MTSSSWEVSFVQSLRLLALYAHLVGTCFLLWTRQDSVSVSIPLNRRNTYHAVDSAYVSLISGGIAILSLRILLLMLLGSSLGELSLFTCLELMLDSWASFWLAWMVLDGLDWTSYIPLFVFCVLLPLLFVIFSALRTLLRNVFVNTHPKEPLLRRLFYRFFRK